MLWLSVFPETQVRANVALAEIEVGAKAALLRMLWLLARPEDQVEAKTSMQKRIWSQGRSPKNALVIRFPRKRSWSQGRSRGKPLVDGEFELRLFQIVVVSQISTRPSL